MTEENDIIRHRREKLAALRAAGESFPNDFRRTAYAADLQAQFGDTAKEDLESQAVEGFGGRSRDAAARDGQGELFHAAGRVGPHPVLSTARTDR